MADFKLSRIRFTWKGTWTAATVYVKDEIVRYGGKSYVCLVGHTAAADFNTNLNYIDTVTVPNVADPRWELWFDGYEWKNNWTPATFYKLGDYVRHGGILYLCITSHTSASTASIGIDPDLASWASYAVSDDWVGSWSIGTRYKLNDFVRYGGTIYRCNIGHTSATTNALGLENDLSKWDTVTNGFDWQTDWNISTRYKLGDVVKYNGIVYKCIIGHTSADTVAAGIDPNISNWTVLHNGVEYRFAWVGSRRYRLNDVVKYGADLYICSTAHTSSSTFSTSNFAIWIPGLQFIGTQWDSATVYIKGDVVTYGGYQYTSNISLNLNNIPSTDTTSWTLLVKNYNIKNDWTNDTAYKTGDLVRRNGYLYVCIADVTVTEPTDPTGSTYWTIVNPGIQWRGPWAINNVYVIGDVVVFNSTSYICTLRNVSALGADPLVNVSTTQDNWTIYIRGEQYETLQYRGDTQTYNAGNPASVTIGQDGNLLKARTQAVNAYLPVPAWDQWGVIGNVYYVSIIGQDIGDGILPGTYGSALSTPWRTVAYACSKVVGPATIFIKTGTYSENLPISVPAGVALVGDELRGTVIQPNKIINLIATGANSVAKTVTLNTTVGLYANAPIQFVAKTLNTFCNQTIAAGNKIQLSALFGVYVNMPIVFSGATFGNLQNNVTYYIQTFDTATSTITVSSTFSGATFVVTDALGAMSAIAGGFAGLLIGQTYYVLGSSITANTIQITTTPTIIGSVTPAFPSNVADTSDQLCNVYGGDAIKDMFYVRNATGIRNMTLKGLLGSLGSANQYGTQRPTSGSYVSLDPGTGPNDTTVHITSKSPYTQNCTVFGQGCTGIKIDGTLHNAGNRSIVANDYTTIISDGIGVWCTGPSALTELVSIFAYYSHCGYLAEAGGRIRATNGNTSYGTYGTVSEGFDLTETPIGGTVNNRNQHAQIAAPFIGEATNRILRLEYRNAGQGYTGATFAFSGAGSGAIAVADEFRDGGIFEFRITGTDFSAGGTGYISAANQAQAGSPLTITIASNDQNTFLAYAGMRIILTSGTGVGQYAQIGYYDAVSKIATVVNESIDSQTSSQTSVAGNTITVPTTAGFPPGTPIIMVPNEQKTTAFSSSRTIATLTQAYIVGTTLFVKQAGAGNLAVGMVLTGSTVVAGTYIIANNSGTGSGSTWLISQAQTLGSFSVPVLLTGTNNLITLTSTAGMVNDEQLVFTGTSFGGLVSGTVYYINNILGNQIAISDNYQGSVKSVSNGTGTMAATAGGMLGGLTAGQLYYVIASNYTGTAFSVSLLSGGTIVPVTTQTYGSKMQIYTVGWENVIAGTPAVALLDSTTVYSIEPAIKIAQPNYTTANVALPSSSGWISSAYGNNTFVLIGATGVVATSTTGTTWITGTPLPTLASGVYTDIIFASGFFVAMSSSYTVAYSTDSAVWSVGTNTSITGSNAVAYGGGRYIAIPTGNSNAACQSSNREFWTNMTLPSGANWTDIAYGTNEVWVAISGNSSNVAAYSINNGDNWIATTLPSSANWISVTWGNSRFVAIATGGFAAAISFDGITWISTALLVTAAWNKITYAQGLFVVVGTATGAALSSPDGVVWTSRALPANSSWNAIVFGNPNSTPAWVATTTSTVAAKLNVGAQAFARTVVSSNKISLVKILEPGSGYDSAGLPIISITDPNAIIQAQLLPRIANGVLGNPTFVNRGVGYRTSTTVVTVATGTGFADIYQISKTLVVSGLASLPTPGAALTIGGNATQYRIVLITSLGSGIAQFQVSPPLQIPTSPEHGSVIQIRQKYSQCRITGHDFLLIGTGNQTVTNYPYTDVTTATPYTQIAENNGGRVFQTSTDQDGNFKVGNLFAVQQASGIVTISADQLSLTGLQTLSLGGFSLGTNAVVITQFSTDSYFTANSDTVVPTQKAIKLYMARNIAGGGSNAQAGAVVAGTFGIGGPNKIYSSTQQQLFVRNSMRNIGGINGTMLAKSFFGQGFGTGGDFGGVS